jgi:predicted RNA-binding Zn ribbon-like protein
MAVAGSERESDWIDGFLFVSNRPILDLLNTKPVLDGVSTELLTDGRALERWLIASGMGADKEVRAKLRTWRDSPELERFLGELLGFREHLRDAVVRIEGGAVPTNAFLSELNQRLLQHPQLTSLLVRNGRIARENVLQLERPTDLWTPIVHAVADLLTQTDSSRLRQCESCVVHFLDTSKKGSRRWCSMNICGNKLKVAAYQQRKRMAEA